MGLAEGDAVAAKEGRGKKAAQSRSSSGNAADIRGPPNFRGGRGRGSHDRWRGSHDGW